MSRKQENPTEADGPLRDLHPQVDRGRPRAGIQLARRPARGRRGVHHEPAARGLAVPAEPVRRRRLHRRQHGPAGAAAAAGRHRGRQGRLRGRLQGRPPEPQPAGLRPDHGDVRAAQRVVRQRDAAVQHGHVDGPADAERAALVRPVRAGDDQRADTRQDRRRAPQGQVVGRHAGSGLRRRRRPKLVVNEDEARARPADLRAVPGAPIAAAPW